MDQPVFKGRRGTVGCTSDS